VHHYYGILLSSVGRDEEAIAEIRRALEIDPFSLLFNRSYADKLIFARKYDDAIVQLKKTLEMDGGFASAYPSLAVAQQMKGNYAESVEALAKYQERRASRRRR